METIIAAAVTGGFALIGVILTVSAGNRKMEQNLKAAQLVTDTKIEELTREVREHNNFARRMPVVEEKIDAMGKRMDKLEDQVNDGK